MLLLIFIDVAEGAEWQGWQVTDATSTNAAQAGPTRRENVKLASSPVSLPLPLLLPFWP